MPVFEVRGSITYAFNIEVTAADKGTAMLHVRDSFSITELTESGDVTQISLDEAVRLRPKKPV